MKAIIETFKPIIGYEGKYEVSDTGCVRSLDYNHTGNSKILKPQKNHKGYIMVLLWSKGKQKQFRVHRLVWEAFRGPIPDGMQIDHINGVKSDNTLSNLRVVTPKENVNNPATRSRFVETCRSVTWREKQRDSARASLAKTVLQLDKDTGEVLREWVAIADAGRELGINHWNISQCCHGKRNSAGGFKWRFPSDAN